MRKTWPGYSLMQDSAITVPKVTDCESGLSTKIPGLEILAAVCPLHLIVSDVW